MIRHAVLAATLLILGGAAQAAPPGPGASWDQRAIHGLAQSLCNEGGGLSRLSPPPADSFAGQAYAWAVRQAITRDVQRQLGEERQKQLLGDESTPLNLDGQLDCAERLLIDPTLEAIKRNCDFARAGGIQTVLGFERQNQLLGRNSGVDSMGATAAAIQNCWDKETKDCIQPGDNERMTRVVGMARQAQLLGMGEDGQYNPMDPTQINICSTEDMPSDKARQLLDNALETAGNWLGIGGG